MSKTDTQTLPVEDYSAEHIHAMEGLEAVQRRPGMYIAGTGKEGFSHLLWELIDNSVDEAAAGYCNHIKVTLHKDGSYEVEDNGRGIPPEQHEQGISTLEVVFTKLHAGGKFGSGAYGASGGLHGVGASVVNALSDKMKVEVVRNGKTYSLDFRKTKPGHFSQKGFSETHKIKTKSATGKNKHGTRVRYWPNRDIFETDAEIDFEEVCERLRTACYLTCGVQGKKVLSVEVSDKREGNNQSFKFATPKQGLASMVEEMSEGEQITRTFRFTESVEIEDIETKDGETKQITKPCSITVAVKWSDSYYDEPRVRTFVNTIPTPDGGTHEIGFERALNRSVNKILEGHQKLKKLTDTQRKATKEDVQEGLSAVVQVSLPEPQFGGQTKRALGTPSVQTAVYSTTKKHISKWLESDAPRSHITALKNKIASAVEIRITTKQKTDMARKKANIGKADIPDKLSDCQIKGEDSEIVIVEGESAAGPAKQGRDSKTVAILPLRGKVINVAKASVKQTMANAEAHSLFTAMGAGIGDQFDLKKMRYGRIIILCDADVDGNHIRCLLLTLIYTYMRPMLEDNRVFVAQPPLFTAKVGGKTLRAFSEKERKSLEKTMTKSQRENVIWQRFKGLGEMNVDDLAECALDKKTRILRRVTMGDAKKDVQRTFEILMGTDVEARRGYIEKTGVVRGELDI